MARFGVEYKEVLWAIAQLRKQKESITIDNIRFVLGTGSKTTIMRHLRYWRQQDDKSKSYDTLRREMIKLVKTMAAKLRIKPQDIVNL